MTIVVRLLINAAALWIAALLVGGIDLSDDLGAVLVVALVFGLINALLHPIAKLLSFPLIVLTLGLFTLVVNAAMLLLTDALTDGLEVDGFGSALLGAIVTSLVSWSLSLVLIDE